MTRPLTLPLVVVAALFAGVAFAGPATDAVKARNADLARALTEPKTAERDAKIESILDETLAYNAFARASLGRRFDQLTTAEKTVFSTRMAKLVRCQYLRTIERTIAHEVAYVGEESLATGTKVKTTARHKAKAQAPIIVIDFLVKSSTKVADVYPDGASLTQAYRAELGPAYDQKGFKELVLRVDSKIADACK